MTTVLSLVALACLLRGLYLRAGVRHHRLVTASRARLLSVELWRRAFLFRRRDAEGVAQPPTPRESRTLLTRCAGLPVWRHVETVGLPPQVADRIGLVADDEFDSAFSAPYRAKCRSRSLARLDLSA